MKNHSLLYFLIFICSLVLGYSVSTRFYGPYYQLLPTSMHWAMTESKNSIQTMNNGQRSILLISTSSINTPNPHLESIWLATYFSSEPTVRLLPILPAGNQPNLEFEQQLARSFDLDHTNGLPALNQDFINILSDHNYWWSGYLIFDEVALSRIINLLGGIDLNGTHLTGEQAVQELLAVLDNPQQAYATQPAILQSACHKFEEITSAPDMPALRSLLPKHFLTDLDTSQLQTEMQSFYASQQKPTCRFPTLEISQVVQK